VDLSEGPFHLIASNPPYIPDSAFPGLMISVRDFEPRSALTAGPEGLDVIAPLIRQVADLALLMPGGAMALEVSDGPQALKVRALFEASGFHRIRIRDDYSGVARVVVAEAPIG
jgi:release factor glutamine methyltransferase